MPSTIASRTASATISGAMPALVSALANSAVANASGVATQSATEAGALRFDSPIRVCTKPGHSTDTPTAEPRATRSWCSDSLRPTTANFVVQ